MFCLAWSGTVPSLVSHMIPQAPPGMTTEQSQELPPEILFTAGCGLKTKTSKQNAFIQMP